jgi:hypothetical protein
VFKKGNLLELVGATVIVVDLAVGQSQTPDGQDAVHVISHPARTNNEEERKDDQKRNGNSKSKREMMAKTIGI